MKTKTITLKGWANNSDLMCCENSNNDKFTKQFSEIKRELLLNGFNELNISFENLRGKNAAEKVVIKGWYWRGAWADATKETYSVFYK